MSAATTGSATTDVELSAEYPGEPGKLFKALLDCRLIDERDGSYHIHDLFDHAPEYVKRRFNRERQRKNKDLQQNWSVTDGQVRPNPSREDGNGATPTPSTQHPSPAPEREIGASSVVVGDPPPVSDESRAAIYQAFDAWSIKDRGFEIRIPNNEHAPIRDLIEALAQEHCVRGDTHLRQHLLITHAVDVLRQQRNPCSFTNPHYAAAAVRKTIEKWKANGVPGSVVNNQGKDRNVKSNADDFAKHGLGQLVGTGQAR